MVWSKIYYVGIEFGKNSKYRGKTNSAPGTIKKKGKWQEFKSIINYSLFFFYFKAGEMLVPFFSI